MPYWKEDPEGVLLSLHVIPNAPRTQIVGLHGEALKIRVHAPPVEGKANEEIIRFFAQELGLAKSKLEIASGELSRSKKIRIKAATWLRIKERLSLPEE